MIDKEPEKHNLDIIRQNIGYVPQTTFLFSDSISNNIKFGNVNAGDDDVIDFQNLLMHIKTLSFYDKYDSILGERGINYQGVDKELQLQEL